MPIQLTINDVVARTGKRSCKFTIPGHELVDGVQVTVNSIMSETVRSRYMVLSLPKTFGKFIKIQLDMSRESFKDGQEVRG